MLVNAIVRLLGHSLSGGSPKPVIFSWVGLVFKLGVYEKYFYMYICRNLNFFFWFLFGFGVGLKDCSILFLPDFTKVYVVAWIQGHSCWTCQAESLA